MWYRFCLSTVTENESIAGHVQSAVLRVPFGMNNLSLVFAFLIDILPPRPLNVKENPLIHTPGPDIVWNSACGDMHH